MKQISLIVGGVILVGLLAWGAFLVKRKFHFSFYYKAEVAKMLIPLEDRIKALETLEKWEESK